MTNYTTRCHRCEEVLAIGTRITTVNLQDMEHHSMERHGLPSTNGQAGSILVRFTVSDSRDEYRAARRQNEVS